MTEQCAAYLQSLPAQERESLGVYVAYIGLREYLLARELPTADLEAAFARSQDAIDLWLLAHPDALLFLRRATRASPADLFLDPVSCTFRWPTVACYMYGVAEPTGDILAATEDGWTGWMDTLVCPGRVQNEPGPRERGWPVWLKVGVALGAAGVSVWMVRSLTRRA